MNGRLISVCVVDDQFDLGLFGGLLQALQGKLVVAQVDALLLLELVGQIAPSRMSKSSPPKNVSPLVDFTSKHASPISSTETSNVPPPRSYNRNGAGLRLVETVSQGSRGRPH